MFTIPKNIELYLLPFLYVHKVCNYSCTGEIICKILFLVYTRPLGFPSNITYYAINVVSVLKRCGIGKILQVKEMKVYRVTRYHDRPVTPNSDGS